MLHMPEDEREDEIITLPKLYLRPTDERNFSLNTNYKVRSIEKALCLMKLFYFNLEAGITEIGLKEEPTVVREITERHIQEANCNSSDYEWLGLIGVAYSEAYAQCLTPSGRRR